MIYKEFNNHIKNKIKNIKDEWKEVYKDYKLTEKDLLIKEFLEDLYTIKDNNEKVDYFYNSDKSNNYYFYTLLQDSENPSNNYKQSFRIKRIYSKSPKTCPLWYLFSRLAEDNTYHFFYTPNIFFKLNQRSGIEENLVKASNVYFVDVDGFKEDLTKWSNKQIEDYLLNRYPFLNKEEFFPSYICASGGGLHLYFVIENTENIYRGKIDVSSTETRYQHKKLTEQLINILQGDTACSNLNRLLRFPFSKNGKEKYNGVRETKLIKPVVEDEIFDVDSEVFRKPIAFSCGLETQANGQLLSNCQTNELQSLVGDDEQSFFTYMFNDDIQDYLETDEAINYYKDILKKQSELPDFIDIENNNELEEIDNIFKEIDKSNYKKPLSNNIKEDKKDTIKPSKINSKPIIKDKPKNTTKPKRKPPESEIEFYRQYGKDGARQLVKNRIRDLEDWAKLHQKDMMYGRRNIFFHIYACLLKACGTDKQTIIDKCRKINNSHKIPEKEGKLLNTINYLDDKIYYYKNETIAEKLCFTIEEIQNFRCNYTEADIQEAVKEKNKRAEEKRKEKRYDNKIKKKKEQMDIIINNAGATEKELMELLGVSRATVSRLKREVKEVNIEENNKKVS